MALRLSALPFYKLRAITTAARTTCHINSAVVFSTNAKDTLPTNADITVGTPIRPTAALSHTESEVFGDKTREWVSGLARPAAWKKNADSSEDATTTPKESIIVRPSRAPRGIVWPMSWA